jgi:matrixin
MRRVPALPAALAASTSPAGAYVICGYASPQTHPFHVDATLPLNGTGTVQDWVGAVILASQEWNVAGASNFRFAFAGLVSPPYPPGASVVTFGSCCGTNCPVGGPFASFVGGNAPYDVSGNPPPGTLDLQGNETHELGHALGLGHSGVSGATMQSGLGIPGLNLRTIEADDIAGIQAIYGAASGPVLDSIGVPYTGQAVALRLVDSAGASVIGLDTSAGPTFLPGIGNVELGFSPAFFTIPVVAPAQVPVSIPSSATLVGTTIFLHAAVLTPGGPILSNPYRVAIAY